MKDLNLSRVINVVAATGLVITTAGCGGGARGAARKVCKAFQECDKSDFEDQYSSMKDCIDTIEEEIDDTEKRAGEDCGEAWVDMYKCGAKAYKKDCDYDDVYSECESELKGISRSCDDYSYEYGS